jgi:hypothetical protein
VFFPVEDWFRAFILTLVVEVPVAAYLLRREEPDRVRLLLLVAFASLATHPIVWYVWTQVFLVGTPEYLVVAEAWAVGVEAVFYWAAFRGLRPSRALLISVAANAASFIAGTLAGAIWPGVFG